MPIASTQKQAVNEELKQFKLCESQLLESSSVNGTEEVVGKGESLSLLWSSLLSFLLLLGFFFPLFSDLVWTHPSLQQAQALFHNCFTGEGMEYVRNSLYSVGKIRCPALDQHQALLSRDCTLFSLPLSGPRQPSRSGSATLTRPNSTLSTLALSDPPARPP